MRHLYTNRVVVLIAACLALAAGLFAWLRSRPAPRAPSGPPAPTPAPIAEERLDAARRLFASDCAGCHAPREPGRAVPSRIQRRALDLAAAPGGRDYLAALLLFGASGEIPAPGGGARRFRHPPYDQRSDDDLAAILNLTLFEPGLDQDDPRPIIAPYEPAEFSRLRAEPLTPEQTLQRRPAP